MTIAEKPALELVLELLCDATDGRRTLTPDTELLDSGLLDSLAMILLFEGLQDAGYDLQPTQVPKEALRTPRSIAALL